MRSCFVMMHPFFGLLKKDYRLSRANLISVFVLMMLFLGFGVFASAYTGQPAGIAIIIILSTAAMVGFIPVMMLSLLSKEGKNQLWVYSPRSSYTLFASKLLLLSIYQVVFQLILLTYLAYTMYFYGQEVYQRLDVQVFLTMGSLLFILIIGYGLYLTCWILFYWTIYHSLNRYPKLRPIRWLIILFIYFIYNMLEILMLRFDSVREFIFRYRFNIHSNPLLNYDGDMWNVHFDIIEIPILPMIYYILLTCVLFYLSGQWLAKKVEV